MTTTRTLTMLAILTSFLLTSCKKDYVCKCSDGTPTGHSFTIHDTKENAKVKCEATPSSWSGCGLE